MTAPAPTLREMVRIIVAQLFPRLPYKGIRRYNVSAVNADGTVDLSPTDGSKLPVLPAVGQWIGPGIEGTPVVGSAVGVAFLDDDPRQFVIVGFAPLRASTPTRVDVFAVGDVRLGGSAATPVARANLTDSAIDALRSAIVMVAVAATVPTPPQMVNPLPSTAATKVKAL